MRCMFCCKSVDEESALHISGVLFAHHDCANPSEGRLLWMSEPSTTPLRAVRRPSTVARAASILSRRTSKATGAG